MVINYKENVENPQKLILRSNCTNLIQSEHTKLPMTASHMCRFWKLMECEIVEMLALRGYQL